MNIVLIVFHCNFALWSLKKKNTQEKGGIERSEVRIVPMTYPPYHPKIFSNQINNPSGRECVWLTIDFTGPSDNQNKKQSCRFKMKLEGSRLLGKSASILKCIHKWHIHIYKAS